jgi:hypothetical protein
VVPGKNLSVIAIYCSAVPIVPVIGNPPCACAWRLRREAECVKVTVVQDDRTCARESR